MNQDRSIYDNLADQFDQLWQDGKRPSLQAYLDQVSTTDRQVLAEMLLPIEIEYRRLAGEFVNADDYQSLGPIVQQVATKLLPDGATQGSTAFQSFEVGEETRTQSTGTHQKSRTIGRYKLLQKLGEGGMGAVWMAEQQHPVRRRVAMKLIKAGADNREIIVRFEAERQALAMMDHPNIAKVLDAGSTEDGLPYFVMELVQGIAINDYCDRSKLSPKQRMELFVSVCKAVQHAHQKGIIHRDLKPSNILVGLYDGKPIAKVIDFGLAKALQHHTLLTDKTMFTQFGQVVGTPQYMSPEQATMDEMGVDTRSDVYSLGVILYELLAGSTPIDKEMMREHALLKILELIREQEPPRPSLRVSTAGEQVQTIGEHRQIQPLKLQQILRGDLDWIVMKAIEKDSSRRYETASSFADDIERYLRGDVIEARPPSMGYRFSKFIGKHRKLAAAVAAAVVLLLAGVVGTSIGLFRAQAAREVADRKTEIAQQKTEELAVEKARAEEEKAHAQTAAKEARAAELDAVKAQHETESTLARSNYFLANARWEQQRVGEARQALNRIPLKHRNFEWYLSQQQFLGSEVTNYHHSDAVFLATFSPDGTRLITGSSDGTVKVVDVASGETLKTIKHRAGSSTGTEITLSPNGKLLAINNFDDTLTMLEVETGSKVQAFKGEEANSKWLAFSPDSSLIATADTDNKIVIRDVETGQETKTFGGHEQEINFLAFSPDGTRMASATRDIIKTWDTETGDELKKLEEGILEISDLEFSPDGDKLVCRSFSKITIFDAATGAVVRAKDFKDSVINNKVAFSPDGKTIAVNSGGKIVLWDAATGREQQSLVGHSFSGTRGAVRSLAFSPDGTKLVSGGGDSTVKIWSVIGSDSNALLTGHVTATLSPDGTRFACCRYGIKIYDALDGRELKSFGYESSSGVPPAFSPDGKRVAVACLDKAVRILDLEKQCELGALTGHTGAISNVAFSPDGTKLASSSNDKTVKLWNALDGSELTTITGHTQRVTDVAFSPDGSLLATGSLDGTIKICDGSSGKQLRELEEVRSGNVKRVIMCIAFSPDGSQLAAGSQDLNARGVVQTWDVETGVLLNSFVAHKKFVSSLAFSPDGTRLASGSFDKTVKLWDASTGSELKTLAGHQNQVVSLAFFPDGTKLISGDLFTIKVWDASNTFKTIAHSDELYKVGFNDDATRIVSTNIWQKTTAWDAATGEQLTGVKQEKVNPKNRISADERWLVAKSGSEILLVDMESRSSPSERSFRKFKTSLKAHQHDRLAREAEDREDLWAVVFHRAWEMRADPYENKSQLEWAINNLKKAEGSKSESDLLPRLPPIVDEMLKRTVAQRPTNGSMVRFISAGLWKKVKTLSNDASDHSLKYELEQIKKASDLHPQAFIFVTIAAADYRNENFESAVAAALKSIERSRLKFKHPSYYACNLAILALSYHKLDNIAEANRFRKQLNDIMEQENFKNDEDSKSFLSEVNELFDAKG